MAKVEGNILISRELVHTSDGHNKFWNIYLIQVGDYYKIFTHWGPLTNNGYKLGGTKKEVFKTSYKSVANARFDALLTAKLNKGYLFKPGTDSTKQNVITTGKMPILVVKGPTETLEIIDQIDGLIKIKIDLSPAEKEEKPAFRIYEKMTYF